MNERVAPEDERLMRLAIAIGRRNNGRTWPNPSVGAVVVDPVSGRILAQGATAAGGRPHAEPVALAAAGDAARGATLYVSLEPCSHQGRTPPCADAVVTAGVTRVVSALSDPDPRVAGRGHDRLRAARVAVRAGLCEAEAARAHRGHICRVREGRPFVSVKLARTADGFAGAPPGRPRLLITREGADARTHLLRAHADAIAVGIGTVLADDPRLDVRLPGLEDRSPVRVVFDGGLRTPFQSRLVETARERPLWILCREDVEGERAARLTDRGAHVLRVPADAAGRMDPLAALRILSEGGVSRLLCEGGPDLAEGLGAADLVDELVLISSERVAAGGGIPSLGPHLLSAVGRLRCAGRELVGPDLIETYERA